MVKKKKEKILTKATINFTGTDEGDLKFNYLSNFGPRFRKLADMYGEDSSEESDGVGERESESWC